MVALEDLNDEQLARLKHEFDRMHQRFDDEGDEGGEGGEGGERTRSHLEHATCHARSHA